MRVVILDIDWVLTSWRTALADMPVPGWDPVACRMMSWLLNGADARFVICGAWREARTRHQMLALLEEGGLPAARLHSDWATPEADGRAGEIMAWLATHVDVREWCVIDNGIGLVETLAARWVETDPDHGLSLDNVLRACALLEWDAQEALTQGGGLRPAVAERMKL